MRKHSSIISLLSTAMPQAWLACSRVRVTTTRLPYNRLASNQFNLFRNFTTSPMIATDGGANFVFVGSDTTHGGNWIGTYGSNGYDVLPNFVSNPSYAQVSGLNKNDWTWNYTTSDGRALQTPDAASRTSGCWYSSGSFSVDVRFTDGQTHRIAVYLCDWDYAGRSETVDLINGDTGAVVQSQTVSGFSSGRYLVWDIKGHFQLRFTRGSGPNAVVNGIFFGPAAKQL